MNNIENIRNQVHDRLDVLESLIPEGSALEIDYNKEHDCWYAMYYKEDYEAAFNITENGKNVIAFEGESNNGYNYDTLIYLLDEADVYYVG